MRDSDLTLRWAAAADAILGGRQPAGFRGGWGIPADVVDHFDRLLSAADGRQRLRRQLRAPDASGAQLVRSWRPVRNRLLSAPVDLVDPSWPLHGRIVRPRGARGPWAVLVITGGGPALRFDGARPAWAASLRPETLRSRGGHTLEQMRKMAAPGTLERALQAPDRTRLLLAWDPTDDALFEGLSDLTVDLGGLAAGPLPDPDDVETTDLLYALIHRHDKRRTWLTPGEALQVLPDLQVAMADNPSLIQFVTMLSNHLRRVDSFYGDRFDRLASKGAMRQGNANLHPTARTAITRTGPSAPVKVLVDRGLVDGRVLDFGSGRGGDAKWLRDQGFEVAAYDPHHGPRRLPGGRFDTVLATYVLNVLDPDEQAEVIGRIADKLEPEGVGWLTVRTDVCPTPPSGVQWCVNQDLPVELTGSGFKTYRIAGRGGRANQQPVGKQVGDKLYVHRSAVHQLDGARFARVKAAQARLPRGGRIASPGGGLSGLTPWTVVRIGPRDVMFAHTTSFDFPHPQLLSSVRVVGDRAEGVRLYAAGHRPVYHRAEQMLAAGDPRRARHAALTRQEERAGLLSRPDIGNEGAWERALEQLDLQVDDDFELRRRR